ncbi:PTS lactose/cellobiose transporter subunit IIA [Spiroplasma endosymbiont of Aspidapion aeneum]|uniref:PTS lactose/cellobiose transporter subunit IIA n=1 Tax=Spiroplasma endosymbiont of Aspidapion aeneum TaxID=3066276 RepID=UPI00313D05E6
MEKILWDEISMTIISNAGAAKSNSIMAISCMEENKFEEADKLLAEADKYMIIAEKAHMDIIVQEAQGVKHDFKVLFMHAEDQMLTTQVLLIMAQKFYNLYKMIGSNNMVNKKSST